MNNRTLTADTKPDEDLPPPYSPPASTIVSRLHPHPPTNPSDTHTQHCDYTDATQVEDDAAFKDLDEHGRCKRCIARARARAYALTADEEKDFDERRSDWVAGFAMLVITSVVYFFMRSG